MKGLTYAEIGQPLILLQKQRGFLNLDDDLIEYAQLKHQPDTVSNKQLQSFEENTPIGMIAV